MKIRHGECWGLVPARGGSRSVPLKNIALLAGRPLIDYCVRAAQRAARCGRILCSTDSPEIAARCDALGIEPLPRSEALSGDATPVLDVIVDVIETLMQRDGAVAEMVALLQPTSPFILPEHIDRAIAALVADPAAGSAQTVVPCPHNHHAFNQRVVADGRVSFRFPDERAAAYNKQTKPRHVLFGNLVVFRVAALLESRSVFAGPSLAVDVPDLFGFDCDGPLDFKIGEALLAAGLVALPHIEDPTAT